MAKRLPKDPQKQTAILTAAMHEFAQNGYQASTDAIASTANVSKGSVFRYFKNKAALYEAAVDLAVANLQDNLDYTVWTDSDDLVSMILRATKYKIELSQRFPDEFTLLLAVYQNSQAIPNDLRQKVFAVFDHWTQENINQMVDPVISRLDLRPDLDPMEVRRLLSMMMNQILLMAQQYLRQHPEVKTIDEMDELISKIKSYMDMIEHGVVQPKEKD